MKKRTFSALLALCMCLMLLPEMVIAEPTTTWYVTQNGAGDQDGTSWANASSNLNDVMNNKAQEGHEIWVAKGTYTPGTDETDTFTLKKGVKVYGGFTGEETSLSDRNWVDNVTTLSGNGVNLHVVKGGSDATPDDTRLDGFTVTGGNADTAEHDNSGLQGGGMYNNNSSPTVANCTFSGNTANYNGGGMDNNNSSPAVVNCTFSGNTASNGGGMQNNNSSPTVVNCTFSGNRASNGGGMYNENSSPTVVNCTFSGNTADHNGGGMQNYNSSNPTVVNCTFSGNTANTGGGMFNLYANPTLANTILWGNTARDEDGADIYQFQGTLTLKNCVVDVDSKCKFINIQDQDLIKQDLINDAPKLKALNKTGGTPATPADVYIYGLATGSSAIDRGLPVGTEVVAGSGVEVPDKDQRGTVRPQGAHVDIGAFEADIAELTKTWYVTQNGAGSQDGTSWDNASSNLKDVMNNKAQDGHEILVAKGTYTLSTDETDTFTLKKGVKVYGGFAGGETSLSARNWVDNVTILDGQGNVYHVVTGGSGATPDDTRLDGFTVTGGNANYPYGDNNSHGGGMFNNNSSPTVVNCTFSGNKANFDGGGMYNNKSSPTVANCTFSGNTASNGGGMYNNKSSPTVVNCTFSGNTASNGGGMQNYDSSPTVVNCTFSGNTANINGGGMQNYDSSPTVVNCTFSGNKASNGGGMLNIVANPTLANTILWGNTAKNESSGPDIYQNGSTLTVKNCVVEAYILVNEANKNIEDLIQTNPLLKGFNADLASETDPVKVYIYMLDTGSSAIDKGLSVGDDIGNGVKIPDKDQLGTHRPQGAGVDIGAFEAAYTITSVTVAPNTVSVETGKTQNFTATVTGTGAYNDTVTWSVEDNNYPGTTISDSGVLTVAADENALTLTVKATSNGDSTKSGTATVTVPTQSDPTQSDPTQSDPPYPTQSGPTQSDPTQSDPPYPTQSDPTQSDPTNTTQSEPTQSDPTNTTQSDPTQSDPTQPDPTQSDPTQPDPTQSDPTQPYPTQSDPTQSDPTQSDPTQSDPTQSDPTQSDPTQSDPTQPDPTQSDPTQPYPTQSDPTQPDPTQSDPTQSDPTQPGKNKMIKQPPVWIKGSNKPASFTSDADFKDFLYVRVDGKVVDKSNYEAKEGSTIVTFKPAFLETLSPGKHSVEIVSRSGSAHGMIETKAETAQKTEQETKPGDAKPKTGEGSGQEPWLALLLLSAGGLLLMLVYREK
ncbi:MAG: choice-of-anchor Q domain-containing protein, partial [Saccharofermentanales bacterium]